METDVDDRIGSIDKALAELVSSSREWVPGEEVAELVNLGGIRYTKSQNLADRLKGKEISRSYSKKDLINRLLDMRGESC